MKDGHDTKPVPAAPFLRGKLGFAVWGVRYSDIMVLMAYPTMGAVFAMDAPGLGLAGLKRFLVFTALNFIFVAHIFIFNDWSDAQLNPEEPKRRSKHALKHPALTSRQVLLCSLALAAFSMAGFALLSWRLLIVALLVQFITAAYSHPRINWKGRPVGGTVIHFLYAILYFCGGWMVFSPLTPTALGLGTFFGLVLAGGHFSNEIQDFNSDLAAGIRTNVIAYGQRRMFRVGLGLFVLSSALFIVIAVTELGVSFESPTCGLAHLTRPFYLAVAGALLLVWLIQVWRYRAWKGGDRIRGFRSEYRMIYAAFCGLLMVVRIIEWTSLSSLIRIFCSI
jgi:4-hydroxybenzoate polyprenyltransferase